MKKSKYFRLLFAVFAVMLAMATTADAQNLVVNGNCEDADNSSFYYNNEHFPITDGEGVDGSKCISLNTGELEADEWGFKVFIVRLSKPVTANTPIKFSMDIKAEKKTDKIGTFMDNSDFQWIGTNAVGWLDFTTEWHNYTFEGIIMEDYYEDREVQYIGFYLNDFPEANTYYFDNITFKINDGSPDFIDGAYQISNADELEWFINFVNYNRGPNIGANAVLTADIVLNENVLKSDGTLNENQIPYLKECTTISQYTGTFDGNGHVIKGFYQNGNGEGLFDELRGTVKNLGIEDFYIYNNGYTSIGGIARQTDTQTIISNCYTIGCIKSDSQAGGICGDNNGTISDCFSFCKILPSYNYNLYFGSICCNNFGTIKNSYACPDFTRCAAVGFNSASSNATMDNVADYNTGELCSGKFVSNGWKQGSIKGSTYTFPVPDVFENAPSVTLRNLDNKAIATPTKTVYYLMQPLDISGAGIGVEQDGRIYVLEKITEDNISGFSTVLSQQEIENSAYNGRTAEIKAGGLTAQYKYDINPSVYGLSFDTVNGYYDYTTQIPVNADLNSDDYKFSFSYSMYDDRFDYIVTAPLRLAKITGLDVTFPGEYHIRLDYGGTSFLNGTIQVYKPVKSFDFSNVKNTIIQYGALSGTVYVNYEDGTRENVDINKMKFTLNNGSIGDTIIKISHFGHEENLSVKIIADPDEIKKDANGYYQIATKDDLYWFTRRVKNGDYNANAILTNDIVVNENVLTPDGKFNAAKASDFIQWIPIYFFTGTFDGDGHTISGLYIDDEKIDAPGFNNYYFDGGTFKNLGLIDFYFKGKNAHGLGFWSNNGTISNCYTAGLLEGHESAGFYAYTGQTKITDCISFCSIVGDGDAFGCRYGGSDYVERSFYDTDIYSHNYGSGPKGYTTHELCSGNFAPEGWNPGSIDGNVFTFPLPKVFKKPYSITLQNKDTIIDIPTKNYNVGDQLSLRDATLAYKYQDNTLKFTPEPEEIIFEGDGRRCIAVHATQKESEAWDNIFFITWDYDEIHTGDKWEYTMEVRADIPASIHTQTHRTPADYLFYDGIGTVDFAENWITVSNSGTFNYEPQDGGHTIAFILNDYAGENTYYFSKISLKINGQEVLSNVDLSSDDNSNFYEYHKSSYYDVISTPIIADNGKHTIDIPFTPADIIVSGFTTEKPGEYTAKASWKGITSDYKYLVRGAIDISGFKTEYFAGSTIDKGTFTVYYNDGSFSFGDMSELKISENFDINTPGTYKVTLTYGDFKKDTTFVVLSNEPIAKIAVHIPQTDYELGEPLNIDGAAIQYIGESGNVVREEPITSAYNIFGYNAYNPKKQTIYFHDGIIYPFEVTVHGAISPYIEPILKDDFYQISDAESLYWFMFEVNNGNTNINALQIDDIIINDNCMERIAEISKSTSELKTWQPIGTLLHAFSGIYDGNGHTISGIYIDDKTQDNAGLFGVTAPGAVIKNLGVTDSYIIGKENVGAIAGDNSGVIANCYSTAKIAGEKNVSGIAGNVAENAVVGNSYYLADAPVADDPQAKTAADFKSGDVAKLLAEGTTVNGEKIGGEAFAGVIDLPGTEDISTPEDPTTPTSEITANANVKIWSFDSTIVIENAAQNIQILDATGRIVKAIKPDGDRIEIPMQRSGIYIVKTATKTQKVIIR